MREAARGEGVRLLPRTALAIDPQDADDIVTSAADRRRDQRAATRLGCHDLTLRDDFLDEIGRRLELRGLAIGHRRADRCDAAARRQHERAMRPERRQRRITRCSRDRFATRGGLDAQSIAELC